VLTEHGRALLANFLGVAPPAPAAPPAPPPQAAAPAPAAQAAAPAAAETQA
jgi:hypothetical protein